MQLINQARTNILFNALVYLEASLIKIRNDQNLSNAERHEFYLNLNKESL